jgi:hypothetical protein
MGSGADGCRDEPLRPGYRNVGGAAEPGSTGFLWPEMDDVIEAVVAQQVFDLVGGEQAYEGFAQPGRDRFERAGHLQGSQKSRALSAVHATRPHARQ